MAKYMSGVGSINGKSHPVTKGTPQKPPKTRTKDKVPYKG